MVMACHKRRAGFRQGNGLKQLRALGERNGDGHFLDEEKCSKLCLLLSSVLGPWRYWLFVRPQHISDIKIAEIVTAQVSSVSGVSTTLGLARAQQWQEALLALRTTPPKARCFLKHFSHPGLGGCFQK